MMPKCSFGALQSLRIRMWLAIILLTGSMTGYAQTDCFDYEDNEETIINGLTATGLAASSLTIPKEVTAVRGGAFSSSSAHVSALIIEAGGNPAFASGLFGERENPLGDIQILGNSMTVANISKLFASLGAQGALSTVYIAGYSGEWSDIEETSVLASDVSVALPAALVSTQQFGAAKVYGRFTLAKDLVSFCGNVTFRDTDNGSNMLFYRADAIAADGRLHITRVDYVVAGEGVLIHNAKNTSTYADLPRVSESVSYASNLLVGVTEPTTIGKTDGTKTNYILKDGAFHPTSGGTVKANKAYLQIPTAAARDMLTIDFDDETTEIRTTDCTDYTDSDAIYDLSGRRITNGQCSMINGQWSMVNGQLYIKNGKKYIIR